IQVFPLSITRAGSGSGSVVSNPAGISCGVDCLQQLAMGTSVVLTATADAGSKFTGWSGACSGTSTCTLAMTAARAVPATFQPTVPPTISSVFPEFGTTHGGTIVTIDGTAFVSGATVKIGGLDATDVVVVSDTRITARTPVLTAGVKDVQVQNTDGKNNTK